MSGTPKSERSISRAAYVNAVVHMKKEVFTAVRKWPARWAYDASKDVVEAVRKCHECVATANAIYPYTQGEYNDKLHYLDLAMGKCQYLQQTLDELYREHPTRQCKKVGKDGKEEIITVSLFSEKRMRELGSAIREAEKLITGTRQKVREDFKKKYPQAN